MIPQLDECSFSQDVGVKTNYRSTIPWEGICTCSLELHNAKHINAILP